MREKCTVQNSTFKQYAEHEIGLELKAMSDWLDGNLDLMGWVAVTDRPDGATFSCGFTPPNEVD